MSLQGLNKKIWRNKGSDFFIRVRQSTFLRFDRQDASYVCLFANATKQQKVKWPWHFALRQCDQIWQIFAYRATAYLGWRLSKSQKQHKWLGYFFPRSHLCINFYKKWIGLHFGRFFSRAHLVTLRDSGNRRFFEKNVASQRNNKRTRKQLFCSLKTPFFFTIKIRHQ
jgi:hypothetical protein